MDITKESLLEYGMIETSKSESFIFPMKKPILTDELAGEKVYMAVTSIRSIFEPCILVPNGVIILKASTIEQLQLIEDSLLAYEHGDE